MKNFFKLKKVEFIFGLGVFFVIIGLLHKYLFGKYGITLYSFLHSLSKKDFINYVTNFIRGELLVGVTLIMLVSLYMIIKK